MDRDTKVGLGVALGALVSFVAGRATANPKPAAPSLPSFPATLPEGQAPIPGVAANWYEFTTVAQDGHKVGALFYADTTSALLLLDATVAAMSGEQLTQFKAFVLIDGDWKPFKK